ncbi:MAG: sensor histidine kinase, partial [Anaerolineae bacterium]|nr:sensor histidine kinase [Anaerolineae bacterium]
ANELLYSYYDQLSVEKHKEYLAEIASRVKYLREMLTQIETVTREEHVTKEFSPYPTDIVALCRRVIQQVQEENGNTHHFELNHAEPTIEVSIDGRLLGHILSHLLTNAVRYSKKETTIQVNVAATSACLTLDVIDQGIGILPEDQPHIFELFFRGGNISTVNGRGIGLKIVRDCVESHNGQISVQSEVGRGTTFTVNLPVS